MLFDCKCQSTRIRLSLLIFAISFATKYAEAARDRGARCEKPDYIPNGSYRIRRDRVMRIICNSGFVLQGAKTIECVRGKWDGEKPVCAKKGCKKDLQQPENGRIQIENDVKAILYCSDNYNLAGNRHSYCNGSNWDRPIGSCRESKNVVSHECDFETDDICGWTYEPREGLEWKRVMAANVFTSFKTGPRHDHTTLTANGGHYMLMESLTRQDDDVVLISPIYDLNLSLKTACCFQFYYFMYGSGVGDLLVVVKPVSMDLDELLKNHQELIKFQKYGNQNNIWNEAHFNIEEFREDFQIAFVAKPGLGQLSDIAIDDVKLLTGDDCKAVISKDDDDFSNDEYDSTTYESIFETQSCAGRCFESAGSGIIRTNTSHLRRLCNCDIDCEDNETCCPDFRIVCLNELFSQSTSISEMDEITKKDELRRNSSTTTLATTTRSTTRKTTPKTTPTKATATTPTTIATTTTTTTTSTIRTTKKTKPTTTTTKTTPTTTKTTPTTTTSTTKILTTVKPIIVKTTQMATTRSTTPSTTTRRTTPTTTATTTRRKTTSTTTSKITTQITTRKTTPTTTTLKTTTNTTPRTSTTIKTTTSSTPFPVITRATTAAARNSPGRTSNRPIPASKPIEYIITDKSKMAAANKGYSDLLLYTLFVIVALILAGAAYRRFGVKAVSWYMIRFKHNTSGDEDASSITTSFKQTQAKSSSANGNSKTMWRNKFKKSRKTTNSMKSPLVNDDDEDDDDDDDIGANGTIALKNNIHTEL